MKRVIAIAFLLVAFEIICSALSPLSYGAVLPNVMFRANLERTGVYKTPGIQRLHGVKWKFKTERVIEAWFSSPTASDDIVYFGSDGSYLYAVNALTGELKWKQFVLNVEVQTMGDNGIKLRYTSRHSGEFEVKMNDIRSHRAFLCSARKSRRN